MKIVGLIFSGVFMILSFGVSAQAIQCTPGTIVGNPKNVEAALRMVFHHQTMNLAQQNKISLRSVSVRLKALRYSQNAFGVKGARAFLRVEAITARGTRIAVKEYGEEGYQDMEVWMYPQQRVVPGTEGGSAYCSAGMNIGSQKALVNVATDTVFGGGYVDSQTSNHINLKTGRVVSDY